MTAAASCPGANAGAGTHAEAPRDVDPTRSKTLRRRYAQRLRGQFIKLRAAIRRAVEDRDVFGLNLGLDTLQDELSPAPKNDIRGRPQPRQRRLFMAWLKRQEEAGVLDVVSRDGNQFIRSAYTKGLRHARDALEDQGIQVTDESLEAVFNQPIHQEAVADLYTRNFELLEDVTSEMNDAISDELSRGFIQGRNPREMARRMTGRVDAIGRHRANLIARTETIRAHSEATLNRYERLGVRNVTIEAEWLTAGDQRVCPICANLEGQTWTIKEARNTTIKLTEDDVAPHVPENRSPSSYTGKFPVRPPAHPNCRCTITPRAV